jgi:hypothetical protein
METNIKEKLNKKNSDFKSKIADIEFAAISAMEEFLKKNNKEFNLASGVRAMYDNEVVYIVGIFLKEGCSSLYYAYESEYQEYKGTAPASHFDTHHTEVFDELVKTYNEIMEEE